MGASKICIFFILLFYFSSFLLCLFHTIFLFSRGMQVKSVYFYSSFLFQFFSFFFLSFSHNCPIFQGDASKICIFLLFFFISVLFFFFVFFLFHTIVLFSRGVQVHHLASTWLRPCLCEREKLMFMPLPSLIL